MRLGLVAAAAVLLELAWTRLLSFQLPWVAVYPVLGLSKLGLAAGALVTGWPRARRLAPWAVLGGVATGAAYGLLACDGLGWLPPPGQAGIATLVTGALVLALPQVAVAALGTRLLGAVGVRRGLAAIGAAAALACLLGFWALGALGPPAVAVLCAALLALVGAERRGAGVAAAALAALLALPVLAPGLLPGPVSRLAGGRLLGHAAPERSQWSARLRVDLYRLDLGGVQLDAVFQDGVQVASRRRFGTPTEVARALEADPVSLPYRALGRAPERVALLGVGAGRPLEAALVGGARHVDAVTPIPAMAALASELLRSAAVDAGARERVTLHVEAVPCFLAHADADYDLVSLEVPASRAVQHAATASPYLLAETGWLTRDALGSALALLREDGWLALELLEADFVSHQEATARLLATLREAGERLDMRDFGRHVVVTTSSGIGDLVSVMVKRSPITDDEVERLLAAVGELPHGAVHFAAGRVFLMGPASEVLVRSGRSLGRWRAAQGQDLGALEAERPFFWSASDRSGEAGAAANAASAGIGESVAPTLALWLAGVLLAAAGGVLGAGLSAAAGARSARLRDAVALGSAGVAAVCLAVWLLQELAPRLCAPDRSLAITLAALAAGAAPGGFVLPRLRAAARPWLLVLLLLGWALAAAGVLAGLAARPGWAAPLRAGAAAATALPLGLLLGALVAWRLGALRAGRLPAAVAALAVGAAVASPLTAALAMAHGLSAVLAAGIGAYTVGCMLTVRASA